MNATEKKYAISRILEIKRNKKLAIRESTILRKCRALTTKKMIELIVAGKVKPFKEIPDRYTELALCFDFSEYGEKVDKEKRRRLLDELDEEVQDITDRIMLGDDAEEARAIIEVFTNE